MPAWPISSTSQPGQAPGESPPPSSLHGATTAGPCYPSLKPYASSPSLFGRLAEGNPGRAAPTGVRLFGDATLRAFAAPSDDDDDTADVAKASARPDGVDIGRRSDASEDGGGGGGCGGG
ncbi:hypothetical protein B296_00001551 [Ensete ventricosum]|uniref:Uncharacterized protein n=1 Tax=Ensete ventricosum TaxID=4639 RepID=A0A427AZ69_ENSVE|nr:hypothetical protein B296_00001551 [Ensete ventricosum]